MGIERSLSALNDAQRQLNTMKRIQVPSDDPEAVVGLLSLRRRLSHLGQLQRGAEHAQTHLDRAQEALDKTVGHLSEARSLGMRALGPAATEADRVGMSRELDAILDAAAEQASAKMSGIYLFSGTRSDVTPYHLERDADGRILSAEYQGDGQTRRVRVGMEARAAVNWPGSRVLGQGETGAFEALIELRDALANSDHSSFEEVTEKITQSLDRLDRSRAHLLQSAADIASESKRITLMTNHIGDLQTRLEALRSNREDADLAEVVLNLRTREQALEGALASSARLMQLDLLRLLT